MQVDTIINARWIIPVEPTGVVRQHHCVMIDEGKIVDIIPSEEAKRSVNATVVMHLDHHMLLPGFINAHTHAAMCLLRGIAGDVPLQEWLQQHIWPLEQQCLGSEFVHAGSLLAMVEMLRGGTTCFNDMYLFPEATAAAVKSMGMRAVIGMVLLDFATPWAKEAREYIQKGVALHDCYQEESLITTAFAPHAPYSVADESWREVITLAEEIDVPIHTHLHETQDEVTESINRTGKRPLQRMHDLGVISERLIAVHATQLEADEIALLAARGSHVAHCPESNQKLASGVCPLSALLQAGVNVCLGTDGAASNNDLDMIGEMRSAALLAKVHTADAATLPIHQLLAMATLHGARALGLEEQIGSLRSGKQADIIAVDLGYVETQPVYDPLEQLIYAGSRHQVSDVWIQGQHLLQGRELVGADLPALIATAQSWGEKIAAMRGA